jgi:hypothetical protein
MGFVHSIHQLPLTSSIGYFFSNFSMAIQEGLVNNKSVEIEYLVAAIYIFWIFH